MQETIKINKSDFEFTFSGIKSLLKKFSKVSHLAKENKTVIVQLDFDQNNVSHLNFALIWRLILNAKNAKNKVVIRYKGSDEAFLNDRHFFDRFLGKKILSFSPSVPIHFETFNPIRSSDSSQTNNIDKIFEDVTIKFLDSNNPFHQEVKIHMLEVINNAFDHSESISEAGSICALDSKNKILDFCVVDMGQGMKQSFLNNKKLKSIYQNLSDQDIIEKATGFRISCNPSSARNPNYSYSNGGIGLFFLKEFVRFHKQCYLVIISQKGYYYIDGNGKEIKKNFSNAEWKGTAVHFKLNLNQDKNPEYESLINNFINEFDEASISIV